MGFWRRRRSLRVRELVLEDGAGRARAQLHLDEKDNTVLKFLDANGVCRMLLGITADGSPRLVLSYAAGKGRVEVEASDRLNSAGVLLTGATGQVQAVMAIAGNGTPVVALFDEDGFGLYPEHVKGVRLSDFGPHEPFDWDDLLRRL